MVKNEISIADVFLVILLPAALFWLLYRHGFLSILDSVSAGVLAGAALLLGVKWLFTKRIIQFGK
jgi:hypothetical protein